MCAKTNGAHDKAMHTLRKNILDRVAAQHDHYLCGFSMRNGGGPGRKHRQELSQDTASRAGGHPGTLFRVGATVRADGGEKIEVRSVLHADQSCYGLRPLLQIGSVLRVLN